MYIKNYKELIIWQRAMELVRETYRMTSLLPKAEQFGLFSQMRRSAVSIPSNIAEGHRRGRKEFIFYESPTGQQPNSRHSYISLKKNFRPFLALLHFHSSKRFKKC